MTIVREVTYCDIPVSGWGDVPGTVRWGRAITYRCLGGVGDVLDVPV